MSLNKLVQSTIHPELKIIPPFRLGGRNNILCSLNWRYVHWHDNLFVYTKILHNLLVLCDILNRPDYDSLLKES